jgi:phage-related protein (TIGR01555 family)
VGLLVKTGLPTSKDRGNGKALRVDGWSNVLTGVGVKQRDKRLSTKYKLRGRLPLDRLESMYTENGIARRVIDLPANSMTRNWFTLTGGEEADKVMQRLETLLAQFHITEAIKWARLYAGSIVLMGIDDGQFAQGEEDPDLTLPVKPDQIKSVNSLTAFSAWREVEVIETSLDTDQTSPTFGQPTIYRVTQLLGGGSFDVHISRLLRFDGALVTRFTQKQNAGWHASVLQSAFEQIRQIGSVFDNAEIITQDFVQTLLKVKDLMNKIATGQEDLIRKRLDLLDLSRHVINTLLLDSEEDFERHSSTVTGLDGLLDRFMMALSAVTGIPVTLLMGRSPAGQNATGESDIRFWYDKVQADQNNVLKPRLEKLIRYLFREDGGKEPEEWSIQFNPLFQKTDKEEAELYKLTAEGDAIYIAHSVLDPNEVAISRFSGEEFNTGVVDIDEKTRKPEEPEAAEEIEEPEAPTDVPADVPAEIQE